MPTTSNFGWTTPADTDLVKDGAAAIRTLGNGIDTSFLDLKGGTTGQVLSKASNTDLDFSWIAQDDADAIQKSLIDAEGDLIVGDAADAVQRLAIGSNGNVLTVDTAVDGKIKWAAPSAGGLTLLSTTTHSGNATLTITGISTAYKNLRILVNEPMSSSTAGALYLDVGAATAYSQLAIYAVGSAATTNVSKTSVSDGQAFINLTGTTLRSSNGDAQFVIDIYDYANTTTYKQGRWTGFYLQGSNYGELTSGSFAVNDATAITQIILQLQGGANLACTVLIYGES